MQTTEELALRKQAELFKALADETRLSILTILRDGEMCVCEIMSALPMSQPAVSHHLKILRQAGLVRDQRRGKWVFYRLDGAASGAVGKLMDYMVSLMAQPGHEPLSSTYPYCKDGSNGDDTNGQ